MKYKLPLLLSFLLFSFPYFAVYGQNGVFDLPLHGKEGVDYFITEYVDHNPGSGIEDPFCGIETYNNHQGTDFTLRSFKTMDSGVYVYAVADGVVFETHDGEYDRSTKWIDGGLGNYIGITYKNEFFTYYGHLKKGSLLVKTLDSVKAGQPIAKVGSSGFSNGPHLHFEVRKPGPRIVDPFSGPCQGPTHGLWQVQPPYDTAIYLIDAGFVPYIPQSDSALEERYDVKDTFHREKDQIVCFWAEVHCLSKGDKIQVEWYTPYAEQYYTSNWVVPDNWTVGYFWSYVYTPRIKGIWTTNITINNKPVGEYNFYLTRKKK